MADEPFQGISVPEGAPDGLRAAAARFSGLAGRMSGISSSLRAMPSSLGAWDGPASVDYAQSCFAFCAAADRGVDALETASRTARDQAEALEEAQREARRAIHDAQIARRRIDRARQQLDDARGRIATAEGQLAAASQHLGGPNAAWAVHAYEAAQAALSKAQDDERDALRALREAEDDLRDAQDRGRRAAIAAREAADGARFAFTGIGGMVPGFGLPGAPASAVGGAPGAPAIPVDFPLGGDGGFGLPMSPNPDPGPNSTAGGWDLPGLDDLPGFGGGSTDGDPLPFPLPGPGPDGGFGLPLPGLGGGTTDGGGIPFPGLDEPGRPGAPGPRFPDPLPAPGDPPGVPGGESGGWPPPLILPNFGSEGRAGGGTMYDDPNPDPPDDGRTAPPDHPSRGGAQGEDIPVEGGTVHVPEDYEERPAANGKGTIYQPPGQDPESDANTIRVMDPDDRYPNGRVILYDEHGHPKTLDGTVPKTKDDYHQGIA